jgi:hypothetical protein
MPYVLGSFVNNNSILAAQKRKKRRTKIVNETK